jgi:hypothetical protein
LQEITTEVLHIPHPRLQESCPEKIHNEKRAAIGREGLTNHQFDQHYRFAVTENHEYHTLQELVCDNSET